jgi:NAD-dependent deacetylase
MLASKLDRRAANEHPEPPMTRYKHIVVLTGSGISAESGIATFRDKDGIWAKFDIEEVATPQAFARNPGKVHDFYNLRRRGLAGVKPNAAHIALAKLEAGHVVGTGRSLHIVTQNVDNLHEAGGSKRIIHMHGELTRGKCMNCPATFDWHGDMSVEAKCPSCGETGGVRPDIVWFGEVPYQMDRISALVGNADLFVSIGTSGAVYPAAGLVALARREGAFTVELNLEPSEGVSYFHEAIHGPASEIVPAFVDRILANA